jgi:hypothetical protein
LNEENRLATTSPFSPHQVIGDHDAAAFGAAAMHGHRDTVIEHDAHFFDNRVIAVTRTTDHVTDTRIAPTIDAHAASWLQHLAVMAGAVTFTTD